MFKKKDNHSMHIDTRCVVHLLPRQQVTLDILLTTQSKAYTDSKVLQLQQPDCVDKLVEDNWRTTMIDNTNDAPTVYS